MPRIKLTSQIALNLSGTSSGDIWNFASNKKIVVKSA